MPNGDADEEEDDDDEEPILEEEDDEDDDVEEETVDTSTPAKQAVKDADKKSLVTEDDGDAAKAVAADGDEE